MEFEFREISCYYKKGIEIILIPKGKVLPFEVPADMDCPVKIMLPTNKETIKDSIEKSLEMCWTKTMNGFFKESVISKFCNIKGYKKVVKEFDFFSLKYLEKKNCYELMTMNKDFSDGSYTGGEKHIFGENIDIDFILQLIQ